MTDRPVWERSHPAAIAEIERLRAALEPFAKYAGAIDGWPEDHPTVGDLRRAKRALEQKEEVK
jgi:hypothetical protein